MARTQGLPTPQWNQGIDCNSWRKQANKQRRNGIKYHDFYWYAGAPRNPQVVHYDSNQGEPYEEPWSEVFLYTYWPTHSGDQYQWVVSKTAKAYRQLFPKMSKNDTHVVVTVVPTTPGCVRFSLCPATDGPDPEFNIRVCVLSPKTIPSVVGGNPALPAATRLIAPAVIPPVPHDDPSHFGSTWTIHDDENDPDHPSPFHANLWWKYANLTAHKANKSGCYVCSILPHAVSQPHLYASPLSETHSLSILNQTLGLTPTDPNAPRYTPLPRLTNATPLGLRATLNHNDLDHCTGINGTCFQLCVNITGANLKGSIIPSHCKTIRSIPSTTHTIALDEIRWLCGWRVYMALPKIHLLSVRQFAYLTTPTF
ncbi:uncharacterized protein [Antennarius striatus]|uniref:uncharacterized protein n=1 Tax=Antennarius striatus TaxID=241820 RepID=UPI0035B3CE43